MATGAGLFVTVDGPSGVGKSTVSGLVRDNLEALDLSVVLTSTPSKSEIGELARHGTYTFHGRALTCLVAADRYHHERTTVRSALKQGVIVLCDRYVPSSFVLDSLEGVEREFIWDIYQHIGVPDIAFVLLGDPALCAKRVARRGRDSRFHAKDETDSRRELMLFREALTFLCTCGYPAYEYEVGVAAAEEVADALTAIILQSVAGST